MSQDDGIRVEYARLRDAAIRVLDAIPDEDDLSPQVDTALRNLRAVLSGETPQQPDTEDGVLDPFEHLLAMQRYVDRRAEPIPLREEGVDMRRRLDGDEGLVDEWGPGPLNVVISELRAMIIAGLLEELAARLSPGAAFGPGRNGEELARVTKGLAKELLDQTSVGE